MYYVGRSEQGPDVTREFVNVFHVRRNDNHQQYLPTHTQGGGCTGPRVHLLLFPAYGGVMRKVSFAIILFAIILAGASCLSPHTHPNFENAWKPSASYDGSPLH